MAIELPDSAPYKLGSTVADPVSQYAREAAEHFQAAALAESREQALQHRTRAYLCLGRIRALADADSDAVWEEALKSLSQFEAQARD
jgi:hypothetical protein